MNMQDALHFSTGFCLLDYRPSQQSSVSLGGGDAFLFFVRVTPSELKMLVSPYWRNFVTSQDVNYVENILADFMERTKTSPDTLFKQVSSLSVGPIITRVTGSKLEDYEEIKLLIRNFSEL